MGLPPRSRAAVRLLVLACALAAVPASGRLAHARVDSDTGERDRGAVYLLLRLGERRLYVMEPHESGERRLDSFPVAVGRKGYDTPMGRFEVTHKIEHPDFVQFDWDEPSHVIKRVAPGPENPLGERWIGFTSAYGWEIGFHGTPNPELLGQAVSHGCVRMRNRDVVKVYDLVDVGTPVIVEP